MMLLGYAVAISTILMGATATAQNPLLEHSSPSEVKACLDEAGLSESQFRELIERGFPQLSEEKDLCLAQCLAISQGILGPDGQVNTEMLKNKRRAGKVPNDVFDATLACLEPVGEVRSCRDMEKVLACFPKMQ